MSDSIHHPRREDSALGCRQPPAAWRVFAWLGGFSLLVLIFLTPPFEVPDEPQHFLRSYHLSQGKLWPRTQGGVVGAELPASLSAMVHRFLGTTEFHVKRTVAPRPLSDTLAELARPLDPGRTAFTAFDTGTYSPAGYVPQAVAITIARAFDVGPLGLLYWARGASALAAWAIICLALRLFRLGGGVALVVAMLPMSQTLMASCSPDAAIIPAALLLTALSTRAISRLALTRPEAFLMALCGVVICSVKPIYLPLLGIGMAATISRTGWGDPRHRRLLLRQLGIAVLVLVITVIWFWSCRGIGGSPPRPGVDVAGQLSYLAQDPLNFPRVAARSFIFGGAQLWKMMLGILGWLTVELPGWIYVSANAALLLAVASEQRRVPIPALGTLFWGALALASALLTALALYLTWTPVATYAVEGLQGRYFLPILPLAGLTAIQAANLPRTGLWADRMFIVLCGLLVVITAGTHWAVARAYGVV